MSSHGHSGRIVPGSPSAKPPGETRRRRKQTIIAASGDRQMEHASGSKSRKKQRAGEKLMHKQRKERS